MGKLYHDVVTKYAPFDARLQQALDNAEGKSTGSEHGSQGWILRHAMDAVQRAPRPLVVVINGKAKVTAADIAATDGVVHIIDAVLMPPAAAKASNNGSPKWSMVGVNMRCDTNAGEGYRGESSKMVADIAACSKSCEEEKKCNSITFFSSGWCSHFNTGCKQTKSMSNAISMRLDTTGTTGKPATTRQGVKFTWAGRSVNTACDAGSGEKFLSTSSKRMSNEEACKKSCEGAAACKSITFYSSGWCSHFSTECTKTKAGSNAISIRLRRAGIPATPATTAGRKFTWVDRFVNTACNARAGEKYLGASSKLVSNEEACKKSCEDAAACKSITFYSSGWCSHFSTGCTKTKAGSNAISILLKRDVTTAYHK